MDGMTTNDLNHVVDLDRAHVWHHLVQHKPFETGEPKLIVEGKGMRVWDQHGKEHIDGVSGAVWTVNVGYGRESIANAVRDQILKMNFFGATAGSVPGALYAEKLTAKMPGMSRVYYANSGSEANEKAFKMVAWNTASTNKKVHRTKTTAFGQPIRSKKSSCAKGPTQSAPSALSP